MLLVTPTPPTLAPPRENPLSPYPPPPPPPAYATFAPVIVEKIPTPPKPPTVGGGFNDSASLHYVGRKNINLPSTDVFIDIARL